MAVPRFPFTSFPNGWFQVAYSEELAVGAVLPLQYFGQDLALFRTAKGEAKVLEAYCSHLGAHLGYGGEVRDDRIVCPFHGWCFDGAGECVDIPYSKKIPFKSRMRSFPVREQEGIIYAYYHADGWAPTYEPARLPNHGSPDWLPYKRFRWKVRTHPQELVENGIDSAHFLRVHGATGVKTGEPRIEGAMLYADSTAEWEENRPDGSFAKVQRAIEFMCNGVGFMYVRNAMDIMQLAYAGHLTPIDGDYIDVRFQAHVKKGAPDLDGTDAETYAMKAFQMHMERDLMLLEKKIYRGPDRLCDGDGPIAVYRRWCRQFYSEAAA